MLWHINHTQWHSIACQHNLIFIHFQNIQLCIVKERTIWNLIFKKCTRLNEFFSQDEYSADLYHFATKEDEYASYFIRVSPCFHTTQTYLDRSQTKITRRSVTFICSGSCWTYKLNIIRSLMNFWKGTYLSWRRATATQVRRRQRVSLTIHTVYIQYYIRTCTHTISHALLSTLWYNVTSKPVL